jgi:hypothetical protein
MSDDTFDSLKPGVIPDTTTADTSTVASTPSAGHLSMSAEEAAANPEAAQAELTRAQWADYLARYKPLENQAFQILGGSEQEAVANAGQYADQSSAAAEGALQRDIGRRGLTVTAEQAAAMSRQAKNQAVLNNMGAKDAARRAVQDRNLQATTNLISIGKGIAGSASESLNSAASMSASRTAANAAAKAQSQSQNMQTVGTLSGLGIAAYAAGLL